MTVPGAAVLAVVELQRDPVFGALWGSLRRLPALGLEPDGSGFDLQLDAREVSTPQGHHHLLPVDHALECVG